MKLIFEQAKREIYITPSFQLHIEGKAIVQGLKFLLAKTLSNWIR